MPPTPPRLAAEGLVVHFASRPVLDGVDFELTAGALGQPGIWALFGRALICVAVAGTLVLGPMFAFVLRPSTWYDARLLVPISGMIPATR